MRFEMAAELRLIAEAPAVSNLRHSLAVARILQIGKSSFQPQRPDPLSDGPVASLEKLVQVTPGNAVGDRNLFDRHRVIGEVFSDVTFNAR